MGIWKIIYTTESGYEGEVEVCAVNKFMAWDVFEELLDKYDITIPDEDRTGDESEARLYGTEYGDTEDYITQILCHLVQEVRENPNATINHFEY